MPGNCAVARRAERATRIVERDAARHAVDAGVKERSHDPANRRREDDKNCLAHSSCKCRLDHLAEDVEKKLVRLLDPRG